jgi:hypothetical protein
MVRAGTLLLQRATVKRMLKAGLVEETRPNVGPRGQNWVYSVGERWTSEISWGSSA